MAKDLPTDAEIAPRRIPIYTIGHGNRAIEEVIALLKRYDIEYVIDVRSQPYSRYNQQFCKDVLEKYLARQQIRYIFMGDALGGRPNDESCYVNSKVDYALVCEKPFYQEGINRLSALWEKQLHMALLCSESKPQECHRSKLIGNTLIEQGVAVAHIDEQGEIKTQEEINQLLTNGQLPLFEDLPAVTLSGKIGLSRKSHVRYNNHSSQADYECHPLPGDYRANSAQNAYEEEA